MWGEMVGDEDLALSADLVISRRGWREGGASMHRSTCAWHKERKAPISYGRTTRSASNKGDAARSSKRAALPNRPDFRMTCRRSRARRAATTAERASRVHTDAFVFESENMRAQAREEKLERVTLPST